MRPLRYSINVTLDGCCDHRAIPADEDLHRHAFENLNQADALLFGRVTYEMMESAWRPPAPTGARPDWMEPFAQTINAAKKYVVSSTLEQVDWNAELVRGGLGKAVQQLKRESGTGLFRGRRGPRVRARPDRLIEYPPRPSRIRRSARSGYALERMTNGSDANDSAHQPCCMIVQSTASALAPFVDRA